MGVGDAALARSHFPTRAARAPDPIPGSRDRANDGAMTAADLEALEARAETLGSSPPAASASFVRRRFKTTRSSIHRPRSVRAVPVPVPVPVPVRAVPVRPFAAARAADKRADRRRRRRSALRAQ
jgi:hypothetical protein